MLRICPIIFASFSAPGSCGNGLLSLIRTVSTHGLPTSSAPEVLCWPSGHCASSRKLVNDGANRILSVSDKYLDCWSMRAA